jgi:predicted acyl esterase
VSPCVTVWNFLPDLYRPAGKSLGTLLIRAIYGRAGLITLLTARYYATHGYLVVNQSCRGTSGSGGHFEPFSHEIDDGADTVAWLRRQAWSTDDSRCTEPLV